MYKRISINDPKLISEAIETLKTGGLIIFPTETCYGVGVDATNTQAVSKVLRYKKRPEGKAISIACSSKEMASKYVQINNQADAIYKNLLPGPVTVISDSKGNVDTRLESEKKTLGIRIPKYQLLLDLISQFGKPITSTSANSAGKKTPYAIEDILENISAKQLELVDLIIDAGELPKNLPSTVIDTTSDHLQTYRKGIIEISENPNQGIRHITKSVEETINLGQKIMNEYIDKLNLQPIIFLLRGDLGAGKTHFTKGIAKALRITRTIKSPTYTYIDEYKIAHSGLQMADSKNRILAPKLYHMDAWRISSAEDLKELQFESMLKVGNVIVIEWPEVIENIMGFGYFESITTKIDVRLAYISDTERVVTVS